MSCRILYFYCAISDLRFLSIDFLNTFLLTYRVFTDGVTVLHALRTVFWEAQASGNDVETIGCEQLNAEHLTIPGQNDEGISSPRRASGASSVSGNTRVPNIWLDLVQ